MAEHSLNELLEIINQQVKSQELLREYLSKATSLIRIALEGDFLAHPALIVYPKFLSRTHPHPPISTGVISRNILT